MLELRNIFNFCSTVSLQKVSQERLHFAEPRSRCSLTWALSLTSRKSSLTSFWRLYWQLWIDFTHWSGVSIADFEKVNVRWVNFVWHKQHTVIYVNSLWLRDIKFAISHDKKNTTILLRKMGAMHKIMKTMICILRFNHDRFRVVSNSTLCISSTQVAIKPLWW